jgi:hypothetical protein
MNRYTIIKSLANESYPKLLQSPQRLLILQSQQPCRHHICVALHGSQFHSSITKDAMTIRDKTGNVADSLASA